MGEPVRIDDVARHLIQVSGSAVEIHYTGLRIGEKLNEDLFGEGEPDERPVHPLVSHVIVPRIERSRVLSIDPTVSTTRLTQCLREIANCDGQLTKRFSTDAMPGADLPRSGGRFQVSS
jgi:FlaA1/EpsC-like NDP-sugar epimerase